MSLCGASFNTKLAVYGSACPSGSGQTIACNDDFCGTASQVSFSVTSGQIYRIRIGSPTATTGTGTMVITCQPAPPPCPADVTHNGVVNIDDLLAVINAWGPCAGCAADINGNGVVNIDDLLAVINAWGPCP